MDKQTYMIEQLKTLTGIPSPTGMTGAVTDHLLAELTRLGFRPERTPKGTVICCLGGEGHPVLLSAHVDTLGAMVRAIKGNGHLRYTHLGGYDDNNIENENILVHTAEGKTYSGTVYSSKASAHVWGSQSATPRSDEFLEVILDEDVHTTAAVEALGIAVGDFISLDPRTVITESGYIKSRHLDDKASSAVLLTLAREVAEGRVTLGRKVYIVFTVYEEVGHGASALGKLADVEDMIAVDMGCVGDDLTCTEQQVSICAKDSAGPYDYDMVSRLVALAKEGGVDYAVDVYPHYSSDASAALRSGHDVKAALIGPGVHASHGMERTHWNGLKATIELIGLYLGAE